MTGRIRAYKPRKKKAIPASKSGVRSPTAHRTPEQTRATGQPGGYQAHGKSLAERRGRSANAKGKPKGDGKDNAHTKAVAKGGSAKGKTTLQSPKKNRGHGMSPGGTKPGARTTARGRIHGNSQK